MLDQILEETLAIIKLASLVKLKMHVVLLSHVHIAAINQSDIIVGINTSIITEPYTLTWSQKLNVIMCITQQY